MGPAPKPPEVRLWAKVDKSGDCWVWTGHRTRGYGKLTVKKGVYITVHRLSWEITNGPIPPGMCVLHKCDNRVCVRPDHLFLGTKAQNNRDRTAKARQAWGERHGMHKLTLDDVEEVRRMYSAGVHKAVIASRFGVVRGTIGHILKGTTWNRPQKQPRHAQESTP